MISTKRRRRRRKTKRKRKPRPNRRRQKKRKHKTRGRRRRGGMRPIQGGPQRITPEQIRDDIETQSREICGFVNQGVIFLSHVGQRSQCSIEELEKNQQIDTIWHTHSHVSKFYPSPEDILKVIKSNNIHTELIYTSPVIWTLTCPKSWDLGELGRKGSDVYKAIKEVNDELYGACEGIPGQSKARQRPALIEHLKTYVQQVNHLLKQFGFQMNYELWPQELEAQYGMQLGSSAGEDDAGGGEGGGGGSKQ